jgi:hypothetical protein
MSALKATFIGPWIFFSLLISCLGQTPIPRSGHSKSEWELSDAPITPLVQGRILASLIVAHKNEFQQDEQDEIKPTALRSAVKFVRLNGRGQIGIEVTGVPPWCGATGNCEIRIFDSKTGNLLVDGDGWDDGFRRTTHHGVFDFYVRSNLSAGSGTRDEYQFDGKVYQQGGFHHSCAVLSRDDRCEAFSAY